MLRLLALAVVAAAIGAAATAPASEWDQLSHGVATSMSTFESAFRGHLEAQAMPEIDFTMPELSAVSTACTTAVQDLHTVYTGVACGLLRTSLGLELAGAGVTQSAVTNWCTSDCLTNLKLKLDGVSASCSASVDDRTIFSASAYATFLAEFRRAQFLTQGICVKNTANKYCWPQIAVMSTLAATGLSAATQTSVAAACNDDCNEILVATVNTYGFKSLIATVRAASLYCMKVDGTYCTPLMANIATAVASVDGSGRPAYATLCVPCISAWFRQVTVSIDSLDIDASASVLVARAFASLWSMLCVKAADGDYCYNKLLALRTAQDASFSAGIASCAGASLNSTCSPDCKAAVVSLDTKLGCCLPATFYAIGGASAAGRSFISDRCGVSLSDCSSKLVQGAIRVKNFLIAFYNNNVAAVQAAIRADIALKLHLSVDQVVLTSVSDSSSTANVGITISFTITPTSTSDATTISSTFTAILTADSSMPATNDVGGEEAKADPSASTSADVSATSTTVVTNPNADNAAAPGAAASAVALLATVVAVVALF